MSNNAFGYVPVADEIAKLRKSNGLTQKKFGDIMFFTSRAVTAWENSHRTMHPGIWEGYLIYFGDKKPRKFLKID